VYPEQSVMRNANRCWNWFDEANQFRGRGEPEAILKLVAETLERHPVDPDRVFVAGLSAGGAMAAILAEQAPDVFAAVGVMAGVALHASRDVASAFAAMHGTVEPADIAPVLARPRPPGASYQRMRATIWTGAHDRTVDPSNARTLAKQFLHLLDVPESNEYREKRADSELVRWYDGAGRTRVETWLVRDMGHAWSGGSFRGSHTFPRGPRASDAMMEFFLGAFEGAARPSLPAS
jgi:poly(hydroxyalkanoate) depolymerase family esterase